MKKIGLSIAVLTLLGNSLLAQDIYGESNGAIHYKSNNKSANSPDAMLYFKENGDKRVLKYDGKDEYIMIKNGTFYIIDNAQKGILKTNDIRKYKTGQGTLVFYTDEKSLQQAGAQKAGTDKVQNFTCTNWKTDKEALCVYKNIPLKITRGNEVYEATKIQFNTSINEDVFDLPKYKIITEADIKKSGQQQMSKMKKQLQERLKTASPQEKKAILNMLKTLE